MLLIVLVTMVSVEWDVVVSKELDSSVPTDHVVGIASREWVLSSEKPVLVLCTELWIELELWTVLEEPTLWSVEPKLWVVGIIEPEL